MDLTLTFNINIFEFKIFKKYYLIQNKLKKK